MDPPTARSRRGKADGPTSPPPDSGPPRADDPRWLLTFLAAFAVLSALGLLCPGEAERSWVIQALTFFALVALPLGAAVARLPDAAARRFAAPAPGLHPRILMLYGGAAAAGALLYLATIFHFVTTIGHYLAVAAILHALVWPPPPPSDLRRRRCDLLVLVLLPLAYLEWMFDRRLWLLQGEVPWSVWFGLQILFLIGGALVGRCLATGSAGSAVRRFFLGAKSPPSMGPIRPGPTLVAHAGAAAVAILLAFAGAALHGRLVASPLWPFDPDHPTILGVDWYWIRASDAARAAHLGVVLAAGLAGFRALLGSRSGPGPGSSTTDRRRKR